MGAILAVLMALSVAVAAARGRLEDLTTAALEAAGKASTLALGLVGILALWMGLMRVAEEVGLVRWIARLAAPVLRRLFPSVPADHPAMGAIVVNFAANVLDAVAEAGTRGASSGSAASSLRSAAHKQRCVEQRSDEPARRRQAACVAVGWDYSDGF